MILESTSNTIIKKSNLMENTSSGSPVFSFRDTYAMHAQQAEWDFQREMEELMDKSPAYKDYYGATLEARKSIINEELVADLNEKHQVEHTIRQGIKAACLGREDTAKNTRIQLCLLERLDRVHSFQIDTFERLNLTLHNQWALKRLAWTCIGLLVYIALRLS